MEGQTYAMKVEEEADEVNMLEKEIKVLIEMRYCPEYAGKSWASLRSSFMVWSAVSLTAS